MHGQPQPNQPQTRSVADTRTQGARASPPNTAGLVGGASYNAALGPSPFIFIGIPPPAPPAKLPRHPKKTHRGHITCWVGFISRELPLYFGNGRDRTAIATILVSLSGVWAIRRATDSHSGVTTHLTSQPLAHPPTMDTYTLNLVGLLGVCAALFAIKSRTASPSPAPKSTTNPRAPPPQWPFLTVYALVMASDWLQGPFLYPLYHDTHRLPPPLITTLFTTGFLAAAGAASRVGALADRHGRRAACLAFCGVYAASCALTTVPWVPALVAGRVLGGVGTSLLFSVFESWMVADLRGKGAEGELGGRLGVMGTVNSLVAIGCGVGSEWVVGWTGRREAPFWVAVGCLAAAAGGMVAWWVSTPLGGSWMGLCWVRLTMMDRMRIMERLVLLLPVGRRGQRGRGKARGRCSRIRGCSRWGCARPSSRGACTCLCSFGRRR